MGMKNMQSKLRLPALDADVVIDGDIVTMMNDEGESVQVGVDEWEALWEKWRFDDVVDYKNSETGMTVCQLRSCIELSRQVNSLEAEKARLIAEKEHLKTEKAKG